MFDPNAHAPRLFPPLPPITIHPSLPQSPDLSRLAHGSCPMDPVFPPAHITHSTLQEAAPVNLNVSKP